MSRAKGILSKINVNEFSVIEVKKPVQYLKGMDTFERAEANMSKEEILVCCKFNIDKYNWREKNQDMEDYYKIIDYAKFAIKQIQKDMK